MLAVVGAGYWGKNLIRNFHALGALSAVVKRRPEGDEKIDEWAPGARIIRSLDEALADASITAIVLATPAETHYAQAVQALDAGKDVFVEKPLALEAAQAEDLAARAEKAGRILMVGHQLEYHPAILKIHELLAGGTLGELRYLVSNRLNWGKFRSAENALWSLAPHDIGLVLRLAGCVPESIVATGQAWLKKSVADFCMAQLIFPGPVQANVFVSWMHPEKERKLTVVGSKKTLTFDDMKKELTLYDHAVEWADGAPVAVSGEEHAVAFGEDEPLRCECQAFLDAIATRKAPLTDGHMGAEVLKVLEAVQRSMDSGGAAQSL